MHYLLPLLLLAGCWVIRGDEQPGLHYHVSGCVLVPMLITKG